MSQQDFLRTLFDQDDRICFANYPYETALSKFPKEHKSSPYFSINALQNARSDANVTKHRTFMLEFDTLPLDEQLKRLRNSDVPLSAIVYSGGKSYHAFIVLADPVSANEYANIAKRLHLALPGVDPSTKNPSRLARLPNVIRPETELLQCLSKLNQSRLANQVLLNILPSLPEIPARPPKTGTSLFQRAALFEARHNPDQIMAELGIQGRNNLFFWLGKRLAEGGHSADFCSSYIRDVYDNLQDKTDFSWREAKSAARISE